MPAPSQTDIEGYTQVCPTVARIEAAANGDHVIVSLWLAALDDPTVSYYRVASTLRSAGINTHPTPVLNHRNRWCSCRVQDDGTPMEVAA